MKLYNKVKINIGELYKRFWNSPTLTTWASFLTRSLSLVIVLPLVLTRMNTADIALWYLFSSVISLQLLVDVGFSPTFSRVIAFAMGGLESENLKDLREIVNSDLKNNPSWKTVERICSTMWTIYRRLTLISFFSLIILGTWALSRPISLSSNPGFSWIAWIIILIVSTVTLLGNIYSSYLQGVNQIALLRRWETLTSLGAIVTSFIVLILNGSLLGLVAVQQGWRIVNILQNRWLARSVENGQYKSFVPKGKDKIVFNAIWPSAWRSGLGNFMSYGLIYISGIAYAQFGSSPGLASYLLGLRLIQMVSQFSRAPFYSKFPLLAKKRAEGKLKEQVQIAKKAMTRAHWVYVAGFTGLGLLGKPLLNLISSNVNFPNSLLWGMLGLAVFAERYGAMHLHLYSTTNHIVWHIANGVSGIIYILVTLLLFKSLGVYTFPMALFISYLSFYCWYSAKYSYDAFNIRFWRFEKSTMIIPLSVMLCYCISSLILEFL